MKNRRKLMAGGALLAAGAAIAFFPLGCSVVGIRTVDEPAFTVLMQEGSFAVRQYEEIVIAETTVADEDYKEAGSIAFRRLFRYISGDNVNGKEIAMTAPVFADKEEDGEKIAMTAPVLAEQQTAGWRYAFVLPDDFDLASAPKPTDPKVVLSVIPKKKVAVIRYAGRWQEAIMREKAAELSKFIEKNGLKPVSTPRSARYDPPWTIPFLRRNEVMIDVE